MGERTDFKGAQGNLGVIEMHYISIYQGIDTCLSLYIGITQLYTFVKIHILHLKLENFIVCKWCLNKTYFLKKYWLFIHKATSQIGLVVSSGGGAPQLRSRKNETLGS